MTMKKIKAIRSIMNYIPANAWTRPMLVWLERMGIDDDTSFEDLYRYETLLFGLGKHHYIELLFAVLDTKRIYNVEQFGRLVDEIYANRWALDEDIRDVYQLHYFLKHDCEEKPDEEMSVEDLLQGGIEPTLGKEMLEKQERWETGGLSCYGWVSFSE